MAVGMEVMLKMIKTKYILETVYTENLKEVWKLTVKKDKKITESFIYDSLPKATKRIKQIHYNK